LRACFDFVDKIVAAAVAVCVVDVAVGISYCLCGDGLDAILLFEVSGMFLRDRWATTATTLYFRIAIFGNKSSV